MNDSNTYAIVYAATKVGTPNITTGLNPFYVEQGTYYRDGNSINFTIPKDVGSTAYIFVKGKIAGANFFVSVYSYDQGPVIKLVPTELSDYLLKFNSNSRDGQNNASSFSGGTVIKTISATDVYYLGELERDGINPNLIGNFEPTTISNYPVLRDILDLVPNASGNAKTETLASFTVGGPTPATDGGEDLSGGSVRTIQRTGIIEPGTPEYDSDPDFAIFNNYIKAFKSGDLISANQFDDFGNGGAGGVNRGGVWLVMEII
jgi:hypothetical protein